MVADNILNSFKKFYIISTFKGFLIHVTFLHLCRHPENVELCIASQLNAFHCDNYTYRDT